MRQITTVTNFPWRYRIVLACVLICLLALLWRVVDLSIVQREFLQNQGDARSVRSIEIPAYRGTITDRDNKPLAVSSPVLSVWVDPQQFSVTTQELAQLADVLESTEESLQQHIDQAEERTFLYLRRGVDPLVGEQVRALNIPGLFLQQEFRRFYPEGEVMAHLLGFTNIDDQGQEGLELLYNPWLQGVPGKRQVVIDRLGQVITEIDRVQEPSPGNDLTLSIDRRIQYLAYHELVQAVRQHQAESGSVVVLDTKTGEILAMVNQPSFNPNKRYRKPDHRYRNRAVTDAFEPGSVIKPFSVMAAMELDHVAPDTSFNTSPGWLRIESDVVRDIRDYGEMDVTEILQRSSNVGISKIVAELRADQLFDGLRRIGFGELSDSNFPGENSGLLNVPHSWSEFEKATISFGYGIAVTTLQLAQAYAIIANQGQFKPMSLVPQEGQTFSVPVFDSTAAQKMLMILETVVNDGTASRASVAGYRVAGKTGTARIATDGSYEAYRHIATFAGIAPVSDPRLVIVVVIHGPQGGQYYGSQVAAPVFSRIMASTLKMLNITPDGEVSA